MTPDERVQLIQSAASRPGGVWENPQGLRELDEFLRVSCGIGPLRNRDEFWGKMEKLGRIYDVWNTLELDIGKAMDTGDPLQVERQMLRMYSRASKGHVITGLVHSEKRTYIIDAASLLTGLINAAAIRGPILDVGCNTGHHVRWVHARTRAAICGIDLSENVVKYCIKHSKGHMTEYRVLDYRKADPPGRFELVYCVDAMPADLPGFQNLVRWCSTALQESGVLILIGNLRHERSEDEVRSSLAEANLGFALAELTGGLINDEQGFDSKTAIVLVNGAKGELPTGLFNRIGEWPEFAEYANDAAVPWDEKTQAYFRALQIDSASKMAGNKTEQMGE